MQKSTITPPTCEQLSLEINESRDLKNRIWKNHVPYLRVKK